MIPPTPALDVLVVDDDDGERNAICQVVQGLGHRCRFATNGDEALRMHEASPAEVIISDYSMPVMDGAELCRRVRASERKPYTYFIFLTGFDDKEHFLRGMEAGADDYHTKPVDIDELQARLFGAHRVLSVYRALADFNERLRSDSRTSYRAARIDALTDVPNRLRLSEDLEAIRAQAERYDHTYSLALCDVDDFKLYNDAFGHVAGDDALKLIASTLLQNLRQGDSVYRYGGEEFLIVFPEQSLAEAGNAAERLKLEVERLGITRPSNSESSAPKVISLSVGIAELAKNEPIDRWITRADAAMYRAKEQGKNRIVLAAPPSEPKTMSFDR